MRSQVHKRFIVLEGIDRCGKDTQMQLLESRLQREGYIVHSGNEPSFDTPIGLVIRKILDQKTKAPDMRVLQRLFVLQRAEDVACFILSQLFNGNNGGKKHIVLRSRFAMSTFAYGMSTGLPASFFEKLHRDILGPFWIRPGLNILIDVSAR